MYDQKEGETQMFIIKYQIYTSLTQTPHKITPERGRVDEMCVHQTQNLQQLPFPLHQ